MPQWAGSCWYYLLYIDAQKDNAPWSPEAERYWMPVDLYVGGVEHAVLHLLYSRFWHKVLYDCGLVSTIEPFQQLFNQGMILAYSYQDANGKYYYPDEVEEQNGAWYTKRGQMPVQTQIEKMSKSKLNVVDPDDVIAQYGADAMRLYELFIGPLSASAPWQIVAFGVGLVSVYSSTSGVVLPAFLPIVPELAERLGGLDPLPIAWSMNVAASLVDLSSLSTVGALFIAGAAAGTDTRKLFNGLLIWGLSMALVGAVLCYVLFG
jgi:hypothetical protein